MQMIGLLGLLVSSAFVGCAADDSIAFVQAGVRVSKPAVESLRAEEQQRGSLSTDAKASAKAAAAVAKAEKTRVATDNKANKLATVHAAKAHMKEQFTRDMYDEADRKQAIVAHETNSQQSKEQVAATKKEALHTAAVAKTEHDKAADQAQSEMVKKAYKDQRIAAELEHAKARADAEDLVDARNHASKLAEEAKAADAKAAADSKAAKEADHRERKGAHQAAWEKAMAEGEASGLPAKASHIECQNKYKKGCVAPCVWTTKCENPAMASLLQTSHPIECANKYKKGCDLTPGCVWNTNKCENA